MKKQKLFSLLLILPIFLSGCISVSNKSTEQGQITGGFFRSSNLGATWDKMNTFYTTGDQKLTFDASSVTFMAYDPLDDSAIYLGTVHDGLIYSYDYGEGWTRTLFGLGTVNAVSVDPVVNCTIYAAVHNAIYKTKDCSRTWEKIYFEPGLGKYITSVAVSNYDNSIVFAGTSEGNFLRSNDSGKSWEAIYRFNAHIMDTYILEGENSQVIYVALQYAGFVKSEDNGKTWNYLPSFRVDQAEVDEDALFQKFLAEREQEKLIATCQHLNSYEEGLIVEGVDDEDRKKELIEEAREAKLEETCQYLTKAEKLEYEKNDKYKKLQEVPGASAIIASSVDRSVDDSVIYANNGSIYRLEEDNVGPIWKQIKLLTPPSSREAIFAVLVNPENTEEIFYATSQALYHSIDGGVNWSISNLPTNHSARSLSFSLDNRFLYLGAFQITQ